MIAVNNNIGGIYALTPLQEGMLYHRLLDKDSTSYFEQNITKFKGEFDPKAAILAFRLVSQKHEVLRTSIVHKNVKRPHQVILRERHPEVKTYNISMMEDKEQELEKIRRADLNRGFDLTEDTLLRTAWIKYAADEYYLLLSFHHIIMDGWCLSIVLGDFLSYYQELSAGETYESLRCRLAQQENRRADYRDYLEWHKLQDHKKGLRYWEELLADCTDVTDVPVFVPVADDRPREITNRSFALTAEQTHRIEGLVKRLDITVSVFLETAIGIFLQKLNGHDHAVYAKIVSGRNAGIAGIEDIVGLFINAVPVVVNTDAELTVAECLQRMMEQSVESSAYDFCSLADIQNRTALGANLIKLMFTFENYYMHTDEMQQDIAGLAIESLDFVEETNYDFSILGFNADRINIKFSYNKAKYSELQMDYLLDMLQHIIVDMAGNVDKKAAEICEYSAAAEEKVLRDFQGKTFAAPAGTVTDMFVEQVQKTPDNLAVVCAGRSLTYRDLYEQVNSLAWHLHDLGVTNHRFVAIAAGRSIEMIVGIYAIMLAGGAYVPIDPRYPDERVDFILKDCEPAAVLVDHATFSWPEGMAVIDLRDTAGREKRSETFVPINTAEDPIYCIYTSGTTGNPKGVINSHGGMTNLMAWLQQTYPLSAQDAILQKTTFVFDVSVSEILWWSTVGARVVMLEPGAEMDPYAIVEAIGNHQISLIDFVPSMLAEFIGILRGKPDLLEKLRSLKYVIAAGEALNTELANEFYALTRAAGLTVTLKNLYGPTEASIYTTYYDCGENEKKVLIGKPVGNCQIYILNRLRPCGIGVPGELCIAGAGLAQGYLNRPQLNAEKFVDCPFTGHKMYRSGDLARWLPDGNIEYLGRIDQQVKIRGFRIELGEVESRIRELDQVRDCAVLVREDDHNGKAICAYIVTAGDMNLPVMKEQLLKTLPYYMMPSYFMQIDRIPVTGNGKLDRRRLPDINIRREHVYVAPQNETETVICAIFSEILEQEQVGTNDDFFGLGGHSLRATRLVNQIEARTDCLITIKDIFTNATPEKLALLVHERSRDQYVPIPQAEAREYYPMSSTQKRTYLICSLDPESTAYHMPQFMEIKGAVRPEDMAGALEEMIERHEILRTSFRLMDGVPVQKVLTGIGGNFEYAEDSKTSAAKLMSAFVRPFDLSQPPLVRMKLVKRKTTHILMLDMHHIISDGMSMAIFNREFNELYHHRPLPALTRQYKDYSEWMRKRDLSGARAYWVDRFSKEIPVLDLATDFTRPQEPQYHGSIIGMTVEGDLYKGIKKVAKENEVTEYMFFLAAAMVLLGRYGGQEDIVIGSPVSARTHKDTETMLGMFTNTLALWGRPEASKAFRQFLAEIKELCLQAYENQEYPFEELVEAVEVKRDFSRNPLFDVMLVMQNNEQQEIKIDKDKRIGIANTTAKFDLTFNIFEENDMFVVGLEYCTDLFKQDTMERMEEHFQEIIRQITANPDIRIGDIQVLTEAEKVQILGQFNDREGDFDLSSTIIDRLEETTQRQPQAIAVRFADMVLTYHEFNAKVNILAHRLIAAGVSPGDFVAIAAERSVEMLLGIYAILKAGAAYVPIDPIYPSDRIHYMLSDCRPRLVLRYQAEITTDFPVLDLERHQTWHGAEENPRTVVRPEDNSYLLYTSGTTGRPKGVISCHRGLHNVISWLQQEYPLGAADTILFKTTFVFDVSASEIFWWCAAGAAIAILPPGEEKNPRAMIEAIRQYNISMVNFVPSMFAVFVAALHHKAAMIKSLKYVLAAGEELKAELANGFLRLARTNRLAVKLGNLYGPTEASIYSTYYNCARAADKIPIGRPIANANVYIMDRDKLCGIGIAGELCIAGTGLAHGYLNQTELMREKFADNPFGPGKMYRSGDLARWMGDGNIEYLGRIDEQVKIRGFRIELGEIDSVIRRQAHVADCAVIARTDGKGDKAIYAYVVAEEKIDFNSIRENLSAVLPEYMVPSYFAEIERIPVTGNGKLDKKSLPEIHHQTTGHYAEPENETEKQVCRMFAEILGMERAGRNDNFFEHGGHSLRATLLMNMIEEGLQSHITLKEFFTNPTPAKLSVLIQDGRNQDYPFIPPAPQKPYYAMSPAQKHIYYISMMDVAATLYNMPDYRVMAGTATVDTIKAAFQKMIDRHEILRTAFLTVDGQAVQRIRDHAEATIEYDDNSRKTLSERMKAFVRPFDLTKAPLMRMMLLKQEDEYLLLTDMHHIIGDGVSYEIFFREFDELLAGGSLPEITCQYKDYSEWALTRDLSGQKEYWIDRLGSDIPVLDLPLDYHRPYDQQYDGCKITKFIGTKAGGKVKELARKYGATEYMIFLSAAMILLSKYARQEDIIIGSPVSGRSHRDVATMIGAFINTLAMRAQPEADKTYEQFLGEIKEITLQALENQEYPFEELLDSINIRRELSRHPVFDVLLDLQVRDALAGEADKAVLEAGEIEIQEAVTSKYDITFNIIEVHDNFGISLEYCTKLFERDSMVRLIEQYQEILRQITATQAVTIGQIGVCTAKEAAIISKRFNRPLGPVRKQTVIQLFEKQAAATPDQPALIFAEQRITYAELNRKANIIANRLRQDGIGPGDFVAIYAARSLEMIMAAYGVMKAGGAYVPIDPMYPEDRIAFMVEDCRPKGIITYQTAPGQSIPVLTIDDGLFADGDDQNPRHINTADDPAYCIYTSGTTGQPKGVVLRHAGLANLIAAYDEHFKLTADDVMLQYASFCFDQSVGDIFPAGCRGAALCIVPEEVRLDTDALTAYMNENKVTVASLTPKLIELLTADDFPHLRIIDSGGEAGDLKILKKWCRGKTVLNTYGPTEATVNSTAAVITAQTGQITIGTPIRGSKIYIVDEAGNQCGIGVPGELCIAGRGLARGYLNRPELTAEKFTANPFGAGRLYHTGDLARWRNDGMIECLGRVDEQVKIRGFRIEPGEIENQIREIDQVRECVIIADMDAKNEMALYAYIVADEAITIADIGARLSQTLPDYMIPSYMALIDSIPLTRSGKLDRKALPAITVQSQNEYIAPRDEKEQCLCALYGEILHTETVGIRDNFFRMGGHSLSALKLVNAIEEKYGVRLALKDIFINPCVEGLALCLDKKDRKSIPIPPAPVRDFYPMSSSQKRLYMICHLDANDLVYNMPECRSLPENIDPEQMGEALRAMIRRHEILRTEFHMMDGEPVQKVLADAASDYVYLDAGKFDAGELDEGELDAGGFDEEKLMRDFIRPFDFTKAPLFRVMLVKRNNDWAMLMDMHHIIGDGISSEIFFDEIMKLYNREELPAPGRQYKDYSEWFRNRDVSGQKAYWSEEFAGTIPVLDLPLDYQRPVEQSFEGCSITHFIPDDLCDRVSRLAARYDATEFMVYLSVTMILLSQYARQEDIIIGTPVSGRIHKDTEEMLGLFVNTLALRGRPEAAKTYADFLHEIRETCLRGYENQDYPFEELVDATQVKRDLSRNPIFSVLFGYQDQRAVAPDEIMEAPEIVEDKTSKFDLTFQIIAMPDRLGVSIEFCTRLFRKDSIKWLISHYCGILEQIIADEHLPLGRIAMVSTGESDIITKEYNASGLAVPGVESVMGLFEKQAAKTPDHVAVVFAGRSLTYRQFNERVNALAWRLRDLGVGKQDFVAIMTERSIGMMVGIYAIIKAGGAYVPIDPHYPAARKEFIMADCRPKAVLLGSGDMQADISGINGEIPWLDLSDASLYAGRTDNPEPINTPDDAIYCIYTSGTTGNPKGVINCHRGMINLMAWLKEKYPLNETDAILQKTTFIFDVSVSEILWWSTVGARLVLLQPEGEKDPEVILTAIAQNKITVIDFVPSMLSVFLDSLQNQQGAPQKLQSLKYVIAAGEALNMELVRSFTKIARAAGLKMELKNLYGPTEASIYATAFNCDAECERVLIGKPIGNYQIYITAQTDHQPGGRLSGIGIPGELCIAGAGLAKGYLNRPDLQDEKFVDNPFGAGKMYRSGDLARWLPDGNIEYLGRIDEQVKLHGFRIELGEIESRIRELDGIGDCAVIVREKNGDRSIYAYVVSDGDIDIAGIKDRLRNMLPYYMVPGYLARIAQIPVTANGKLDKAALPDIYVQSTKEFIPPRNEREADIGEAYGAVLNMDEVSMSDDFFELGGDSIKLIRMVNLLAAKGIRIHMRDVYTCRTVEKLALQAEFTDSPPDGRQLLIQMNREMKFVERPGQEWPDNPLRDLLAQYDDNIHNRDEPGRIVAEYDIPLRNGAFLRQRDGDICFNFDVYGAASTQELVRAIKAVVKEQTVLRTFLNKEETTFEVAAYTDEWMLPVIAYDRCRQIEQDVGMVTLLSQTCSRAELYAAGRLLVKILLTEGDGCQRVYVFAHHAVWDNESSDIFVARLKEQYANESSPDLEYNYFTDLDAEEGQMRKAPQWFESFLQAGDDLKTVVKADNTSAVLWGKKLSPAEERNYQDNRFAWTLSVLAQGFGYQNGKTAADLARIPLLLNHNGRNDANMHTLGLYLDLIPIVYDGAAPSAVYTMLADMQAAGYPNGYFHNYLLRHNPAMDYFAVDINLIEVFAADDEKMLVMTPMFAENTGESGMSVEIVYGKGFLNIQMSFNPQQLAAMKRLTQK